MVWLIILFVVLVVCASYIPMPQPLRVGLYVAAGIVLLLLILSLAGLIDGPPYFYRRV